MEQLTGMPVTLLIKAPNQKLGDQTVECFLDWSVQKLKNHLAKVYPSKPNEKNQRIIYSGKLLKDNLLLKDVLRLDDKSLQHHTVHLVCSPSPEELLQPYKPKSSPSPMADQVPSSSSVQGNSTGSSRTDGGTTTPATIQRRQSTPIEPSPPASAGGLRHRTVSTPSFSNFYPYSYGNYPMQYVQRANQQGYMAANQQQQAMWMQHMYAQQMAQYLQYSNQFQAGGAGLNANLPAAPAPVVVPQPQVPDQPGVINPPVVAPNVGAAAAAAAAGPDQNVRMNAGLGPAVDDDDEDNVNRDWLDWVYTFCRFGVMLSLVYFYSSPSRFLMVVGFMIFMYLYQKRWFRLHRAPIARERLENRNEQQEDREQDNSNQEQQQDENSEQDASGESQEEQETDSDSAETATAPLEPPRPGVLTVAWVFLSTFFTSLFPQDPNLAAVN
ncbi:homocysteine-responsive endoplasmic reticulum-resident ubiquitin-like domain member 2 protein [Acanthaster planci]|uniref:Homocysteine-responsive endoplasmic reticulum-resident ubiquitin-like domain member 2 protein n=1 Tax=Acanthaster planci TaxID=133434 RepID=A0A8B7YMT4_ACAPL|nr:homocysteine-responsive endoplasmic reticulum-resident ubiquitin-like domain member 2 protein [Acanthaster planci]XP_022094579.1 homocysteine-responsive endoplasmic reticulum-resident ubiquitin-like domain member 2 protein [Acanthaster planci]